MSSGSLPQIHQKYRSEKYRLYKLQVVIQVVLNNRGKCDKLEVILMQYLF